MTNTQEQQLQKVSFEIPQGVIFAESAPEERPPVRDEWYDPGTGRLGFLDCLKCDNKGFADGRECDCMPKRRSIFHMKKSGLGELLERCTFDSYETPEAWQAHARRLAMQYTQSEGDGWLYMAGQSGCGKTHLCTAVCGHFLQAGQSVRYELWRDLVHELQGLSYRPDEYRQRMEQLRNVDILYLDDFLKNLDKNAFGRELTIAYEVINARYNLSRRTILSSEHFISDVCKLDEALGSRIASRAKGFKVQIRKEEGRNYRLRSKDAF